MRHGGPAAPVARATLLVYHRDGSKVAPLPREGEVVVGRTFPADVVVDDRSLSRQHAKIIVGEAGVEIEDMGSTNGTWVKGERITRTKLAPGQEARLGDVTVVLHAPEQAELPGAVGYDRFLALLEDEALRARTFGRPASLWIARATGDGSHVARWGDAVAALLRPVDRAGLYADDTLAVVLPETDRAAAASFAGRVAERLPDLLAGIATFPDDAATAEELVSSARAALRAAGPGRRVVAEVRESPQAMVVESDAMRAVRDLVLQVAPSMLPVLVLGETGTGKELVARAVHESSPRRAGPLKTINCAAIPASLLEGMLFGHERGAFTGADRAQKGIFEQASGGTVLLDEVGELSSQAQAALLRVLETKRVMRIGGDREVEVDVRLVAATHRDLEAMVEGGSFRRDLLFRLDGVSLVLPPLRERGVEIERLALLFVTEANRANGRGLTGIAPDALALMRRYPWPGNVRELKNAIERAVVIARGDVVTVADLPERVRRGAPPAAEASVPPPGLLDDVAGAEGADFKERVRSFTQRYEAELIVQALRASGGNLTKAAEALKIPVRTLTHKMKELGIKKTF